MRLLIPFVMLVLCGCGQRTEGSKNLQLQENANRKTTNNAFVDINQIMVIVSDQTADPAVKFDQKALASVCVSTFTSGGLVAFPVSEKNRSDPKRKDDCHFIVTTFIQKTPKNYVVVAICTISTTATTMYGGTGYMEIYTNLKIVTVDNDSAVSKALEDICKSSIADILRYRAMK